MPENFHLRIDLTQSNQSQLRLQPSSMPGSAEPFHLLLHWIQRFNQFSQIQAEQGMDWVQIRFYFRQQPFHLHFEHYSECYWIDADSQYGLVLLSQLAEFIASTEYNHRLSRP